MKTLPTGAIAVVLLLATVTTLPGPALAQDGTHTVSGKVVDDAGNPIEGAQVSGWTSAGDRGMSVHAEDVTDAAGAFELRLPAGKGYLNVYHNAWGRSDSREITIEGDVTDLQFTIPAPPPKTARLEGRVTDTAGNPIEGATVNVWRTYVYEPTPMPAHEGSTEPVAPTGAPGGETATAEGNSSDAMYAEKSISRPYYYDCCYDNGETARTDADGRWSVLTYGDSHRQVTVTAPGYAQAQETVKAVADQTVSIDISLEKIPPRDAILLGRVLDAETGLPVRGAVVSLQSLEWGRYDSDTTDADGAFRIRTYPGWVQLNVAMGYGYAMPVVRDASGAMVPPSGNGVGYYQYVRTLEVASGDNELDVKLEPKPKPTAVLVGYVVDPVAETGVANAYVNLYNQDTGEWGSAQTDETGSYKFLVRPGHYTINANADGYLSGAGMFVVREGEGEKRYDVETPKGRTRYAICGETSDCDDRVYATDKSASPEVSTSGNVATTPTTAPTPPPAAPQMGGLSSDSRSGSASFEGSGGGLPPYSKDAAPTANDDGAGDERRPSGTTPTSEAIVPGFAPVAALVALLAAVLLASRRR